MVRSEQRKYLFGEKLDWLLLDDLKVTALQPLIMPSHALKMAVEIAVVSYDFLGSGRARRVCWVHTFGIRSPSRD